MAIDLEPGKQPPSGCLYPLSHDELEFLREYLDEMLKSGKICPSKSPAGAPIFFVPKSHGRGLRIVVDYRGLNAITIKDCYPLPLITDLIDRVGKAQWFTKLNLKNSFNLVRIASSHEWKTAFKTRYGAYKYTVMPMGLTNAPLVFQWFMNLVLGDLINRGVVVYIDDILIYSESEEEHTKLVTKVLELLHNASLCISLEKSIFHAQ